jgi:glycosyltransferase involved in cell wall biosynthesis
MRLALVHDHLTQHGGAEQVLLAMHQLYPSAPLYTLVYDSGRLGDAFSALDVRPSFLQRLPGGVRHYQWLLPLMPWATERYDLRGYDVVLSSSSAFSKGALTSERTLHLCYCHTPTRYLWSDTHGYVQELRASRLVKAALPIVLHRLRVWDRQSAERVDRFVANSRTVAERIRKYYGRESDVIYPPVETAKFSPGEGKGGYFLAGGRLVSYKRFDLVIQAFNRMGLPLKIFGDGPLLGPLRRSAKPNIEFVGRVDDDAKAELYRGALAYLNPQEEDFGITAVEAMASGRPVIAFRRGGATETVVEGVTGAFFDEQAWEDLAAAVIRFDASRYDPGRIRAHALQYDAGEFKRRIAELVSAAVRSGREESGTRVSARLPVS